MHSKISLIVLFYKKIGRTNYGRKYKAEFDIEPKNCMTYYPYVLKKNP